MDEELKKELDAEILRHKNAIRELFIKHLDLEHLKSKLQYGSIIEDVSTGDILKITSRTRCLPTTTDIKFCYNRYTCLRLKKDGTPRVKSENLFLLSDRIKHRPDLEKS